MSTALFPTAPLLALDTVWFQVAGTLCNLECSHCFISCSPANDSHPMMSLTQVRVHLEEAARLGVREYYFTGGEPFLNKELLEILAATLEQGPASVLTNGTLIKRPVAERLAELDQNSEYSLDLRVSIEGWSAEANDPIRGAGTFERILEGVQQLAAVGINPVITVTEACEPAASAAGRTRFLGFLREIGLQKPRLKVMPLLRTGAEAHRLRGYQIGESLRGHTLSPDALELLQCSGCRMVTARGVYVCPLLIDAPDARMADTLSDSLRPFELRHPSCYTCWETGFTCRT